MRKALGVRTFFNMLGPLVNPVQPRHQLLGVYNLKLQRLYNYIAQNEGINCTVVHSLDGYDEISLTAPFKVVSASGERVYTPAELGFATAAQQELSGGESVAEAAAIFDRVLEGRATSAQMDCVVANSAFALMTLQPDLQVGEAVATARESIESGRALECFKRFLKLNGND